MVGARPVKNALWYELSIAAYFSSQSIRVGNLELDLKGANVDPNRRPYPKTKTAAGYPSEVDITITKLSEQYNISCKFTERSDSILKQNSHDFLKAVLELMPICNIEIEYPELHMNYFLVTNWILSKSLGEKRNWDYSNYIKLSKDLLKLGKAEYGEINSDIFRPDKLELFIQLLTIYSISIVDLEKLQKSDPGFQKAFETLPKNLLNIPRRGLSLNQVVQPDLTVFCDSKRHNGCCDCVLERKYCHFGHISRISARLNRILSKKPNALLVEISCSDLGVNPNKVSSRDGLAPETIAHKTSLLLSNKMIMNIKYPFTFYVVPSTFEIIAFNAYELAKMIESTQDIYKRVYPFKVPELNGLNIGFKAIQEIVQLSYLKGFNYRLPQADIILDYCEN